MAFVALFKTFYLVRLDQDGVYKGDEAHKKVEVVDETSIAPVCL